MGEMFGSFVNLTLLEFEMKNHRRSHVTAGSQFDPPAAAVPPSAVRGNRNISIRKKHQEWTLLPESHLYILK